MNRGRGLVSLVPLVVGLLVVALTVSLGNWQVRRAQDKLVVQAQIDTLEHAAPRPVRADAPDLPEWQPLSLIGRWWPDGTILLDNRTHGGRAGYHVLTPLVLADGSGVVLVNRGWIAVGADRGKLPLVPTATGLQQVEGRLHRVESDAFTLADRPDRGAAGKVWQTLDLESFRTEVLGSCADAPFVQGSTACAILAGWTLLQTSAAGDGLVRDWVTPAAGIDRHRGYAFQWYALAGLAAVLTAWYAWRLFSRRNDDDRNARLVRN